MSDQNSYLMDFFLKDCFRVVSSLLQLSERWPCHIWLVSRTKYASLEANLCGGWGLLVC